MMAVFRVILIALWLSLWFMIFRAVSLQGVAESWVFVSDFQHPWRAMLNADFCVHLLAVGAWIVYRERSLAVGVPCALLAVVGGMPFTLAYIFVATYRESGDMRGVFLGTHA